MPPPLPVPVSPVVILQQDLRCAAGHGEAEGVGRLRGGLLTGEGGADLAESVRVVQCSGDRAEFRDRGGRFPERADEKPVLGEQFVGRVVFPLHEQRDDVRIVAQKMPGARPAGLHLRLAQPRQGEQVSLSRLFAAADRIEEAAVRVEAEQPSDVILLETRLGGQAFRFRIRREEREHQAVPPLSDPFGFLTWRSSYAGIVNTPPSILARNSDTAGRSVLVPGRDRSKTS